MSVCILSPPSGAVGTSSEDFILLQFPKDTMDQELVWLLGNFCEIIVKFVIGKKKRMTADRAAAMLKSRLLFLQTRAVVIPQIFNLL